MYDYSTTPHLCECGCGETVKGKKSRFCRGHQLRSQFRTRTPITSLIARHITRVGECDIWAGAHNKAGYARFRNPSTNEMGYTHRFIWERANGPIPSRMVIMHSCDNPACIRLDHLFLGTQAENIADMLRKGRKVLKVSDDDIQDIKDIYATGKFSLRQIGQKYGVTHTYVRGIINGSERTRQWTKIQPEDESPG